MHVFLFEHFTGGGRFLFPNDAELEGIVDEGAAMLGALVEDFAAVPGVQVSWLGDAAARQRIASIGEQVAVNDADSASRAFDRLAASADATLLIAPEWNGLLAGYGQRVLDRGGRLLGPPPAQLSLASDKHHTAECLHAAGVPVPQGRALDPGQRLPADFTYPAVRKPRDGAGSREVYLVVRPRGHGPAWRAATSPERLERFCPGPPASVAVFTGPAGHFALPACRQHLSSDGTFAYQGGSLPIEPSADRRARALATRAIDALGPTQGYWGVDLVLGEDPTGADDYVIELNPRPTTSYVGLRRACRGNLAAALLDVSQGNLPEVEFDDTPWEFTPRGAVRKPRDDSSLVAHGAQSVAPPHREAVQAARDSERTASP